MTYNVSSGFKAEIEKDTVSLIRRFYIGTSDYSNYVQKWPRFRRKWNEIRPVELSVQLANHDNTFDFFRQDKSTIVNSCRVEFGVQYAVGSEETIDLYRGSTSAVQYRGRSKAICTIRLKDKLKSFSEITIGTNETPVEFTNSNHLVHDLAWYIVTSYGGYSAIESTSNPDIDYQSFNAWAAIFSDSNVRVKASFDGQKITNILRKIGRISDSSIVVEDDKLRFSRYTNYSGTAQDLGDRTIISVDVNISDEDIVNNQIWQADYDVDSDYYSVSITETTTYSVNTFGQRDAIEEDTNIWYVDSISAQNAAQRVIQVRANPIDRFTIKSTLKPIFNQIGDTICFSDDFTSVNNDAYRILGYDIDMEKCMMTINCDQSQQTNFFTLDVDSAAGQDALGWLDQAFNPLG